MFNNHSTEIDLGIIFDNAHHSDVRISSRLRAPDALFMFEYDLASQLV